MCKPSVTPATTPWLIRRTRPSAARIPTRGELRQSDEDPDSALARQSRKRFRR